MSKRPSAEEQSQCDDLKKSLCDGSLNAALNKKMPTVAGTSGCLKGQSAGGSGSSLGGAQVAAAAGEGAARRPSQDNRKVCLNCSKQFFAQAADAGGAGGAGGESPITIASFCSTDCLWSFSMRIDQAAGNTTDGAASLTQHNDG
jgi:hypothetical protein